MSEQPIGFGIIGAGTIAPTHAKAIAATADARLVCVCDVIEQKARALAEEYQAQYTTDLDEMLARDDIQTVCVCTPSGLHHVHALAAAEAGKHILCEKPMDITLQAIDEMIQAAEENKVKLAAVFQQRTFAEKLG